MDLNREVVFESLISQWCDHDEALVELGYRLARDESLIDVNSRQHLPRISLCLRSISSAIFSIAKIEANVPSLWRDSDVVTQALPHLSSLEQSDADAGVRAVVRLMGLNRVRLRAQRTSQRLETDFNLLSPVPSWITGLEVLSRAELAAAGVGLVNRSGKRTVFTSTDTDQQLPQLISEAYGHVLCGSPDTTSRYFGKRPDSPALMVFWATAEVAQLRLREVSRAADAVGGAMGLAQRSDYQAPTDFDTREDPAVVASHAHAVLLDARPLLGSAEKFCSNGFGLSDAAGIDPSLGSLRV